MSRYIEHAKRELAAMGETDAGMVQGVLDLLDVFSKQGHSGFSAPHMVGLFRKLAMFEPLAPLTGADDEWEEVDAGMWQNIRCSHVFKDESGAYDIDGRIFREPNGCCFANGDSCVPVTFPYIPKREYVDVPERQDPA